MSTDTRRVLQHLRSEEEGKVPSAEQIELGEIAVNYNANEPFLTIKDNEGNLQKIPTAEVCYLPAESVKSGDTEIFYYAPSDTSSAVYETIANAVKNHKIIVLKDMVLSNFEEYEGSGEQYLAYFAFDYYLDMVKFRLKVYSDGTCSLIEHTDFQPSNEIFVFDEYFDEYNFSLGNSTMPADLVYGPNILQNEWSNHSLPAFYDGLPIDWYYYYTLKSNYYYNSIIISYKNRIYLYYGSGSYYQSKGDLTLKTTCVNNATEIAALSHDYKEYLGAGGENFLADVSNKWTTPLSAISSTSTDAVASNAIYGEFQKYATTASTVNFITSAFTEDNYIRTDAILSIDCGTY